MARWRRVVVHPDLILEILSRTDKRHAFTLSAGIPVDAQLVEVVYHRTEQEVSLIFSHDSFADVHVSLVIPSITPTFETVMRTCVTCGAPCAGCAS